MNASDEQAAIAEFIASNGVKRLPKRSATAPAIKPIRRALSKGRSMTIKRGRGPYGRTITFNPGSVGARIISVQDEGGERRRRRSSGR